MTVYNINVMELRRQICSFEQAVKLLDIGLRVETLYVYKHRNEVVEGDTFNIKARMLLPPALTVSEIGILLPYNDFSIWKEGDVFNSSVEVFDSDDFLIGTNRFENFKTEAEARAEILIWLISNRYLLVNDLKL